MPGILGTYYIFKSIGIQKNEGSHLHRERLPRQLLLVSKPVTTERVAKLAFSCDNELVQNHENL